MTRRPPSSTLFPTRRSSDLTPGLLERFDIPPLSVCGGWAHKPVPPEVSPGKPDTAWYVAPGQPNPLVDRKSTRLNSSHLGISYAVFCLKKKNKNIQILITQL